MSQERIDAVEPIVESRIPKKVRVIDFEKAVEKSTDGKFQVVGETLFAIIEGPKGYLVIDTDGVHRKLEEKAAMGLCIGIAKKEEGTVPIIPDIMTDVSVENLLHFNYKEQELGQFVRRFGDRIERNYRMLLESIQEIGLDPLDYPRGDIIPISDAERRLNNID